MNFLKFGFLLLICSWTSWSQTLNEVQSLSGLSDGLCVQVGITDDGSFAADMAANKKTLVHVISTDPQKVTQVRETIQNRNLYGFASAEEVSGLKNLPYPDNFVNILVIDLDALGQDAPTMDEIKRVLNPLPYGAAIVKQSGNWQKHEKQRPSGMDDWTHYFYGPEQNAESKDAMVRPKSTIKWVSWYTSEGYGKSQTTGMRSEQGIVVHEQKNDTKKDWHLTARDGFNGLKKWQVKRKMKASNKARIPLVMKNGILYTGFSNDGENSELVGIEAATGEVKIRFPEAGLQDRYSSISERDLIYSDNTLFNSLGKKISAHDPVTGSKKWIHEESEGLRILWPSTSEGHDKIYYVVAADEGSWSRWPGVEANSIVALNKSNGTEIWRNTEISGYKISNLIVQGNKLFFSVTNGIGSGVKDEEPKLMGLIDASTGNFIWSKDYEKEATAKLDADKDSWERMNFLFQPVVKDDKIWLMNQKFGYQYNLQDGKAIMPLNPRTVNQRCPRPITTERYLIIGFGLWYDTQDNKWFYQNVSRSDCGTYTMPANGMTYNTPNECTCYAQIRGYAGFSSELVPGPIDEKERYSGPAAFMKQAAVSGVSVSPQPALAKTTAATKLYPRESKITGSVLEDMWYNTDVYPYPETEPVQAGGKTFVAVVNKHRLEARSGGQVDWSFTAGARISTPPVIENGKVYFGSHDGYVYALNEDDGSLQWKFLAAPNHRKIMAYGQLESAWPVYGVVMFQGRVAASAGRHPELDGGIYVYGLHPENGEAGWKGQIAHYPEWRTFEQKDKSIQGWENHILNASLVVNGDKLLLPGSHYVHERFPTSTMEIKPDAPPVVGIASPSQGVNLSSYNLVQKTGYIEVDFPAQVQGRLEIRDMMGTFKTGTQGVFKGKQILSTGQLSKGRYLAIIKTKNDMWTREFTVGLN